MCYQVLRSLRRQLYKRKLTRLCTLMLTPHLKVETPDTGVADKRDRTRTGRANEFTHKMHFLPANVAYLHFLLATVVITFPLKLLNRTLVR
mmetsp:Transcript_56819/g.133449  ORF Transcript_56819/g.133449 Transcript_56819/m.133449 type:complete len:91 (-) Transcript_56819:1733-2005(-)